MRAAPVCVRAIVAAALVLAASAPASAADRIHDCASFRAWLRNQPGWSLATGGFSNDQLMTRNGMAASRPRGGSDELRIEPIPVSYFRGSVGGGGCLGGAYDAAHRTALVVWLADTYRENIASVVVEPPVGLVSTRQQMRTRRGVTLGMPIAEVEAIEGRARRLTQRDGTILLYKWQTVVRGSNLPESFQLSFLTRNGVVVAIEYGWGY